MTARPRLLDLFCGAGGAARGYHDAGFDVTGVDIASQPRYPYEFVQADAMKYPLDGFDAIHASPPCQDHSFAAVQHPDHGTGWMLDATLDRLRSQFAPWIVENVVGSGLLSQPSLFGEYGVVVCGASFGLGAIGLDLARHRLFQSSIPLWAEPCSHRVGAVMSVAGHSEQGHAGRVADGSAAGLAERREAMGIDWMSRDELAQAIPPAYTKFLGAQLLAALPVEEPTR